jgi:2-polyprenyl-3-methyl-5-hydroxy-6-metoxy-1,4-benzoquinol methylase
MVEFPREELKLELVTAGSQTRRSQVSASTDNNLSIASPEFVWVDSEVPEAHSYLFPPTLKILRESQAQIVLDLGCGNGACSATLKSKGFEVTGCDVSSSGIALARRAHPDIEFFEQDVSHPLPSKCIGHYEAVVSFEVVEHLLQPRHLAQRAFDALRPGGIFVVSTPFHGYWKNLALALANGFDKHWHPLRDFGHVKFFSKKTLSMLLQESGFSIKHSHRVGRIPALARSLLLAAVKPL